MMYFFWLGKDAEEFHRIEFVTRRYMKYYGGDFS